MSKQSSRFSLENFPTIDKGPSVYPAAKNNRIMFLCEFKSEDNSKHSEFEVTWYQGTPARQLKKMTILTGAERVATIQNTNQYPNDPLFFLGTTVIILHKIFFLLIFSPKVNINDKLEGVLL